MHPFGNTLPRHLLGRSEQGSDDHLEAEIAEGRSDDLLSAVVPILADFGDEDFGWAPFRFSERCRHLLGPFDCLRLARRSTSINPARDLDAAHMPAPYKLERLRHFSNR